ncbi:MAG TPA: transposase [Pyrinomonadaceae bacterium]|nr:transposase [Pyrinomonadaceae bacterium]
MILPALGIDIAKLKFNICLINQSGKLKHKVFPNTTVGFQQLDAWLIKHGAPSVHACMEATGAYVKALALHLHGAGHRVSVINTAAFKAFAGKGRASTEAVSRVRVDEIAKFKEQTQDIEVELPREIRHLWIRASRPAQGFLVCVLKAEAQTCLNASPRQGGGGVAEKR